MIAKFDGKIEFDSVKTAKQEGDDGEVRKVVIGRTGEIRIIDEG
jgi:DNA-directed RNA polymerase subunit beta'